MDLRSPRGVPRAWSGRGYSAPFCTVKGVRRSAAALPPGERLAQRVEKRAALLREQKDVDVSSARQQVQRANDRAGESGEHLRRAWAPSRLRAAPGRRRATGARRLARQK